MFAKRTIALCARARGCLNVSKIRNPRKPWHNCLPHSTVNSLFQIQVHIQYAPFGGMPLWWNILHQTWLEAASKLQAVVFTRWCEEFFHWTPLGVIMMWYQTCISVQVLKHVSVDELCRWNFGSGSRCSQSTQCVFFTIQNQLGTQHDTDFHLMCSYAMRFRYRQNHSTYILLPFTFDIIICYHTGQAVSHKTLVL